MNILKIIFPTKEERKKKKIIREIGRTMDLIKLETNNIINNIENIEHNLRKKNKSSFIDIVSEYNSTIQKEILENINKINDKELSNKLNNEYEKQVKNRNNLSEKLRFLRDFLIYSSNIRFEDIYNISKKTSEFHYLELKLGFYTSKLNFLKNTNRPTIHNLRILSKQ
jgi:flagellar biosynthesis GTPase FlhF